jgi:hypothetical protein
VTAALPGWSPGSCLDEVVALTQQRLTEHATASSRERDALLQALCDTLGRCAVRVSLHALSAG